MSEPHRMPSVFFTSPRLSCLFMALLCGALFASGSALAAGMEDYSLSKGVRGLVESHPGRSGLYSLEKGEEALLARAWLADHAEQSIEVQYFIWSTDNIGILAAESLLSAAERGVRVRVVVDDLLIDAPDDSLVALAAHPLVAVRIYNPLHKVGTSGWRRLANLARDFRGANQRMHDKTFIVDGLVGITGGRNMADEYFDYDHHYNFRDRDILVLGTAAAQMRQSFEAFWQSPLAIPVEQLLENKMAEMTAERQRGLYAELHEYAANPDNFAPQVRQALEDLPEQFPLLLDHLVWDEARFISDLPGKNDGSQGLSGGGRSTAELAEVLATARQRVTIQSPYLILTEAGLKLCEDLVARGVKVRISTNSLASTDNLQAFSGYRKQRADLLEAGVEIREFRPDPAIQQELIERYRQLEKNAPVFALHAKTLVVDGETLFVGTFNLDPRSVNLNTEVGILVRNPALATQVEGRIERDMAAENSWNPAEQNPDRHAGLGKRLKLRGWMLLPLDPLL